MGNSMLSVHHVRAIIAAPPIQYEGFVTRDIRILTNDGEVEVRLFADHAALLRIEGKPEIAPATAPGGV